MFTRRQFIVGATVTGTALRFIKLPAEKIKSIEDGALFTIPEIEDDNRFISEYMLGVSLRTEKFFKFKTEDEIFPRLGVIADQLNCWQPYFFDQLQDNDIRDDDHKLCKLTICTGNVKTEVMRLRKVIYPFSNV